MTIRDACLSASVKGKGIYRSCDPEKIIYVPTNLKSLHTLIYKDETKIMKMWDPFLEDLVATDWEIAE